jgi:hypothetical protein
MSASHATTRLETARGLLASKSQPDTETPAASHAKSSPSLRTASWREVILRLTGIHLGTCPSCGSPALERRPLPRRDSHARAPPRAA